MKWPDINLTEVFNGIMIVGALALAWVSRKLGTRTADGQGEPMQLAGAVIDNSKAEQLEAAFVAHTEALEDNTRAIHQSRRETTHAMESLEREIQDLTQETIRAGRRQ
ncbi:hypothetical protein DLJ53_17865 [Acuticoccus sediminis]|uniref:Uncharacterized protein n=1 Tax=Acuticoccus sediminis TaxID=2184697 RepID=A0A8B2NV90_9HYPH|nr:hypothetical protein [Acuticoccus sediminis]RAI01083.1 hypothetical protein DLJ53_17865 [Acuticoccus sediminis]